MNPFDDDLTPFRDDPVVRALTGPATPDELAGEEQVLAAFRAAPRAGSRRRFASRLGTGAGAVVVVLGLSGGVAAAYSQALPGPVQRFFHSVLGPVGVPPAERTRQSANGSHHGHGGGHGNGDSSAAAGGQVVVPASSTSPATTPPSAAPAASARPTSRPTRSTVPRATASATSTTSTTPTGTPSDTSSPTDSPSPTPTPTGSPTPTYGDPSTWTLSGASSTERVLVHGGVGISGRLLTSDGRPIPDHEVSLSAHVPGTDGSPRIQVGSTDSDGVFSTYISGLNHTTVFALHAGHGVHSAAMRVAVVPTLASSQTATSDGTGYDVAVTSDGADPGDNAVLLRRENGTWVQAGSGQLDSSGQIVFRVPKPVSGKVHYLVRLKASRDHASASVSFVTTAG